VPAAHNLARKPAIINLLKVTSHYDSKSRHFGKDAEIQAMDGNLSIPHVFDFVSSVVHSFTSL